jgi:primary-amine oxidase
MNPYIASVRRAWARLLLAAGLATSPAFAQHPLDPLNETEILSAAFILLNGGAAVPGAAFQGIDLREPSKASVLGFQPGNPIPRSATVFFRQNKESFRSVVNLTAGTFTPPVKIPKSEGQLGLTIGEIFDFAFLFQNQDFLAALALRGIDSPPELARVFVTPLTAGSFGLPEESRRIVKAQMYFLEGAVSNLYARPIEGIQAIVDLDDQVVIEILDTGAVPVPAANHNFDEASVAAEIGLRPLLKPIRITQPEGVNFVTDGHFIEWQKWRMHVRFDRRSGIVLSLVTYDGRSVLYQGALSEVFVPYQDPDQNWFYRTFMDVGEFGFGTLASPLKRGLDVPENARLFNAVISAAIPDPEIPVVPLPLENVIGVFERVTGNPEWRHFELFAPGGPAYEGRAEVELVVRMIAQVGNYDYAIDWVFTQRATIRVDVALTGIDATKGVRSTHLSDPTAAKDTAHGALVAPQLVATNHSHHFNFRLDLDIDGPINSFALGELETERLHPRKSPRRSVWTLQEEVLKREKDLTAGSHDHARWRIFSPTRKNAFGYDTSYLLESQSHDGPLLHPEDYARAGFIQHALWLTAYDADELFAAGDTPNQHPGRPGLPEYIKNNESVASRDLVLWHTLSHHHVTAAEDYPVLPRANMSFELKPANFFDRNPALDLRRAPFEPSP